MQTLDHLNTVKEFAQIVRGEHAGWSGDRRSNGGFFLYSIRKDMPEQAKDLAYDIECNMTDYMNETGLPERTLVQAQRVLYGMTCDL